jgi:hypothetical protein
LLPPSSNVAEKIQKAEKEKEEGNKFFKEGDYRRALQHYHQVNCHLIDALSYLMRALGAIVCEWTTWNIS